MAIIVSVHGDKRQEDQAPTQQMLNKISEWHYVMKRQVVDDHTYDDAVSDAWGLDELIVIEQDIEFTRAQIDELLDCKHDLCAFPYWLYEPTTGISEPYLSNRIVTRKMGYSVLGYRFLNEQDIKEGLEFTEFSGLGLTKFSLKAQQVVKAEEWHRNGTWLDLDHRISMRFFMNDMKFHLHLPPVKHNHLKERNEIHDKMTFEIPNTMDYRLPAAVFNEWRK
jgi:hypothetical protein